MKPKAKNIYTLLFIVIITLILGGCSQQNSKNENKKGDTEMITQKENDLKKINNGISWRTITKEYLTEHFNITEEALEGVDIESFLSTYEIDINNIEKYDIQELLKFFAEEDATLGIMSYEYMLDENANGTLTSDNITDITRISYQRNESDFTEAIVFDFKKEKIYEGCRINNLNNDNLVGNTDDTIKQKVIQTLSDYKIYDWKDYYKGGSTEGTTASYNWQMAIEFSDGTLWQTGGDGLGKKAYPANMEDFITALRKCEPQNPSTIE